MTFRVRLTAVGPTREEALAEIAPVETRIREELGETSYGLQQQIKAVFDPLGILNPGKVV